jgi:type III secretion protein T
MVNAILIFLDLIWKTCQLWPAFSHFQKFDAGVAVFFTDLVKDRRLAILCLAAPILIVLFFPEFGLGLVNRFAPQLTAFFLAMLAKSW